MKESNVPFADIVLYDIIFTEIFIYLQLIFFCVLILVFKLDSMIEFLNATRFDTFVTLISIDNVKSLLPIILFPLIFYYISEKYLERKHLDENELSKIEKYLSVYEKWFYLILFVVLIVIFAFLGGVITINNPGQIYVVGCFLIVSSLLIKIFNLSEKKIQTDLKIANSLKNSLKKLDDSNKLSDRIMMKFFFNKSPILNISNVIFILMVITHLSHMSTSV